MEVVHRRAARFYNPRHVPPRNRALRPLKAEIKAGDVWFAPHQVPIVTRDGCRTYAHENLILIGTLALLATAAQAQAIRITVPDGYTCVASGEPVAPVGAVPPVDPPVH